MRRATAILALLAGCSDEPPGLSLEVIPGDPAVTTVELFVGERCHDCPSVAAPPAMERMALDDVYLVADPVRWTGDARGVQSLGFRIPPRDKPHRIGLIHVVGYDDQRTAIASGSIYGYELRPGIAEHGQITLRPTKQLDAPSPMEPEGTRRIAQWSTGTLPACTLAELWRDDGRPHRDLIVPATDLDCDGHHPNDECAPWIPDAVNEPPTIEQATCMTTFSNNDLTCYVGGDPCTEGSSPDVLACVPLERRHCAPDLVCNSGVAFPYLVDPLHGELVSAIRNNATIYLRCQVRANTAGWCNSEETITGVDAASIIGTTACETVGLHPFAPPFGLPTSRVDLPIGRLELRAVAEPCVVDLKFTGGSPSSAPELAWLNIQLATGRHLFIPTMVEKLAGCGDPARCWFERPAGGYDNFDRCVAVPQPARCAPAGDCTGPICGGVCCGAGKSCVDVGGQEVCGCGGNSCSAARECRDIDSDGCGVSCCDPSDLSACV
jgi:hypothetical protein